MTENSAENFPKVTFERLHEDYQEVKKLQKSTGGNDDHSSRRETLLNRMLETVNSSLISVHPVDPEMTLRLSAMRSTLLYERAKFLIDISQEDLAEKTLTEAFQGIEDVIAKPQTVFLGFRIANHRSYLLTKREGFQQAKELLEFTERVYDQLKSQFQGKIPFHTSDELFCSDSRILAPRDYGTTNNKLERLVTNNLQMLGFVYNKLQLHDRFAEYHHKVLQRQLDSQDGDKGLWAVRAARLASYFLGKERFREARNHLAAATLVMANYEQQLRGMSSQSLEKWKDFQQKHADLAKGWVRYGLALFGTSKAASASQLYDDSGKVLEKIWVSPVKESKDIDTNISPLGKDEVENNEPRVNEVSDHETKNLRMDLETEECNGSTLLVDDHKGTDLTFNSIDLTEYENQVTASVIESTVEARKLFIYIHFWLKQVKVYYTLREYPMEYINGILDLSELYRYLAFYEDNIESQYAVQKLRADALETLYAVLREVKPQCYFAISIELLRELAEVQLELMGLNLTRIYMAQDGDNTENSEFIVHKMEAVANIHTKLEEFGDKEFGHEHVTSDNAEKLSDTDNSDEDICKYINSGNA